MSRLHLVVGSVEEGAVLVRDLDGREQRVSLLAYDGAPPRRGDWLVAQSGFAVAPADRDEALAALAELHRIDPREAQ